MDGKPNHLNKSLCPSGKGVKCKTGRVLLKQTSGLYSEPNSCRNSRKITNALELETARFHESFGPADVARISHQGDMRSLDL